MSRSDPVVVVTGGGSGIGEACCRLFASRGWRVVVADINSSGAERAAEAIDGEWRFIDVSDAEQVGSVARDIESEIGPVQALVNSAGIIQRPVTPDALSLEDYDRIVNVDQRGTYVACLAFGSSMMEHGGGSIVNLSSIAGMRSVPLHSYGPAKAAVISMTTCLATEWGPRGLRVNAVAPGYTLTPALQDAIDRGERDISAILPVSPLGRMVTPEDVAEAVFFLSSPAAAAITGINLPVDCGWLAGTPWATYGGLRGGVPE